MRKRLSLFVVLILYSVFLSAQSKNITGKVTDQQGQPVPFATIRIKGSKQGVSADADGNFSIKVLKNETLVVTGSGLTEKEVKVTPGTATLTVQVSHKESVLNEVVVTTALGVRRQSKELGYSTATVGNKEINQAGVTNVLNGLSAKVSGVSIRLADNSVNPNIKINFRGTRSINGSNTALIVVDGVIVDQSYLTSLNTEDIENVNILKGANASALYGKDASNGVMIITTKKGRKGSVALNYKNTTMATQVSYFPSLQYEYGGYGGEGGSYLDPLTGFPLAVPFENQSYGPAFNSRDFPLDSIAIGGPNPAGVIKYAPYKAVKNGRQDFFATGLNEQNSVSLSGANSWGSFYASGENADIKGIVPMDKSIRNTARFNGSLKLGNFSAVAGVSYSSLNVNQAGLAYSGGTQYRPVYWDVVNQPAQIDLKTEKNVDGDYFASPDGYINAYYTNPWYQVYHSRTKQDVRTLTSNLQLDYKFTNWLSITVRGTYTKTKNDAPSIIDSFAFDSTAISDYWGAGNVASANPTLPYQYEDVKINYWDFNNDAFLTFKKKANLFDFTLVAGANYRERKSNGYWYSNQRTSSIAIPSTTTTVINPNGSAYITQSYKANSQAVYGDLTVGYDEWVFVHGSYRNDWNSILFPATRSFNYGGVDASVILTDKFNSLKSSNGGLSFLKIRGGWSVTGNISLPSSTQWGLLANQGYGIYFPTFGAYSIYPTTSVGTGFPYGSTNGYSLSYSSVQTGLKPEKDRSVELGVEMGFLKDRIRLEAVYFNIKATNQTLQKSVSYATGTNNLTLNSGAIQDNGVELDLKLTPLLQLGKFKFNLSSNFTYVDNKVLYLTKGDNSSDKLVLAGSGSAIYNVDAVPGQSVFSLYASDWNRDPQGHIIVDGTTGMPSVNSNKQYAGNTEPKYFLGLNPNFAYGRLSLNVVLDYRGGNKILNNLGTALDFSGISSTSGENRSHFIIPNSVIADGNGYTPNKNIPISSGVYQYWSTIYNSIGMPYMVNASFWKLRETALVYDLPLKMLGSQKIIKRLTFSLIGQNLLMIRAKTNKWTDPEFSTSINANANAAGSVNEYVTPPTRSYGFSINTTF